MIAVTPASAYGTDTLWNYEVGVRTSWLDNRLTANAVVYYIDWTDIQLRTFDLVSLGQKIQNAGKVEIFGLETEIDFQMTDNLRLSMNYGYTDSSLAEDFVDSSVDRSTTPPTVTEFVAAADGDRLPGSSKHTLTLRAGWQMPLTASLDLQANLDYRYVSSRTPALTSGDATFGGFPDVPSSEVVNLSAGVRHDNGVTLSLFANNLLDERNIQYQLIAGVEFATMNRPRTIGLRAGYQF